MVGNPIRKFTVQKTKWFVYPHLLSPVPCLYPVGKMALASFSAFLSTMSPFSHSPPYWVYFCCRCPLEFFYPGPRMTQISSFAANKPDRGMSCACLFLPQFIHLHTTAGQAGNVLDGYWMSPGRRWRGDTVVPSGEPSFSVTHSPSLRSSSPFIPLKSHLTKMTSCVHPPLHSQELSGSLALCPRGSVGFHTLPPSVF